MGHTTLGWARYLNTRDVGPSARAQRQPPVCQCCCSTFLPALCALCGLSEQPSSSCGTVHSLLFEASSALASAAIHAKRWPNQGGICGLRYLRMRKPSFPLGRNSCSTRTAPSCPEKVVQRMYCQMYSYYRKYFLSRGTYFLSRGTKICVRTNLWAPPCPCPWVTCGGLRAEG